MLTRVTPREGEKVHFVVRKSFAKLAKKFYIFLAIFFVGFGLLFFSPNEYLTIAATAIIFFSVCFAFYYFLIWYYDIYLVTNERIVSVEQKGLFSKNYSEIELDQVREVAYSVHGVFATIFRFGTVSVRGYDQTIELSYLPNPGDFQEMVKKLISKQ